jgi:hypothetical protein
MDLEMLSNISLSTTRGCAAQPPHGQQDHGFEAMNAASDLHSVPIPSRGDHWWSNAAATGQVGTPSTRPLTPTSTPLPTRARTGTAMATMMGSSTPAPKQASAPTVTAPMPRPPGAFHPDVTGGKLQRDPNKRPGVVMRPTKRAPAIPRFAGQSVERPPSISARYAA